MKTYNFDLRYIDVALLHMSEIEEGEYINIINLIEYLQSVGEYSLDFPETIFFKLPDGKKDKEYDSLTTWLIEKELFFKHKDDLKLTKKGKEFFKKLETKCVEIEQVFLYYKHSHC